MKILKEMRENPSYCIAWLYWGFFIILGITAVRNIDRNVWAAGFCLVLALLFLNISETVGVRGDLREIEKKLKEKK